MPQPSTVPGDNRVSQRAPANDAGHDTRLNGWKEIAAYLGRGERTVKRWDSERELPVHRVPGGGRAAVHAYVGELERWLQSNRGSATEDGADVFEPPADDGALNASGTHTDSRTSSIGRPSEHRAPWRWVAGGAAIAALVAALLTVGLRDARGRQVSPADQALAHDLYLKGRFEWSRRTPESLNRALDNFTQSIVHDPTSAPTYSGLADTYLLMHEYSLMPEHEAYDRARAAATKAVALDDSLSEAHRSLAFVYAWGSWDFVSGEKEIRRAIDLDPRDPIAHLWYATMFECPAWYAVAEREFDRAQELDPSSTIVRANKSIWLFDNGRTNAGLELARQVEKEEPDAVAPHRYLALMTWRQRDYPGYLDETEQMATLKHDGMLLEIVKAARVGYKQAGEQGMLQQLYIAQRKFYESGQLSGEAVALTCTRLGKRDEALDLLQDDFDHRRADFLSALDLPDFLAMRDDPRYRKLMAQLHFPTPSADS